MFIHKLFWCQHRWNGDWLSLPLASPLRIRGEISSKKACNWQSHVAQGARNWREKRKKSKEGKHIRPCELNLWSHKIKMLDWCRRSLRSKGKLFISRVWSWGPVGQHGRRLIFFSIVLLWFSLFLSLHPPPFPPFFARPPLPLLPQYWALPPAPHCAMGLSATYCYRSPKMFCTAHTDSQLEKLSVGYCLNCLSVIKRSFS